jgi:hypothetical protein
MIHQCVWKIGQKKVIFGYMQKFLDGSTATPTHSYVHDIAALLQ